MCLSYPEIIFLHQFCLYLLTRTWKLIPVHFKKWVWDLGTVFLNNALGVATPSWHILLPTEDLCNSSKPSTSLIGINHTASLSSQVVPMTDLERSRSGFTSRFQRHFALVFLREQPHTIETQLCHGLFLLWERCTLRGFSLLVCCPVIPRQATTQLSIKTQQVSFRGTVSRF